MILLCLKSPGGSLNAKYEESEYKQNRCNVQTLQCSNIMQDMTFSPSWRYLLSLLCTMCENPRNPLTPKSFHSFHEYHICHTIETALCCVPSSSLSIL